MNVSGTTGESSCKRQENGDSTMEPERPLKKARFAWQVKGKYHLKNEITETAKTQPAVPIETDNASSSSYKESKSNDLIGNTEQNLEILGDYLLKQDFNTLGSVITDTNKSILPSSSLSQEKLPYPRYISSYENNNAVNNSSNENASIPMSMVTSHNYSEDQCIARWQARQMAKGFVDNTINRVLDSWMVAPLPADMDNNRFLALDVAEFINNLPGDNSIENEGILMAISAHGLQKAPSSESTNCDKSSTSISKDMFSSPPSSPLPSDEEVTHKGNTDNKSGNLEKGEFDMPWSYSDDLKGAVNNDISFFPDKSNSSYQCFSESNHQQTPTNDYEADENLNLNENIHNYDFIDAAVSFAILNKGLTSFESDYG